MSHLWLALSDETQLWGKHNAFDASVADLKTMDLAPSDNALTVHVGDSVFTGDQAVVCLSEQSPTGTTFAIARVATGPGAGTFFDHDIGCGGSLNPPNLYDPPFNNSWPLP